MNKQEFLAELGENLKGFDSAEISGALEYYGEIIDDMKEASGKTENEAVASLGNPKNVIAEIKSDLMIKRIENSDKKTVSNTGKLLKVMCVTPVLFPLGIALSAVLFALVITLGSLIVAFGAASFGTGIALAPAIAEMITREIGAMYIVAMSGGYLFACGACGMLAVCLVRVFGSTLEKLNRSFSKRANKKAKNALKDYFAAAE